MKRFFTTIVLVFIYSVLFAQVNYDDVIHLKDSSIVKGKILKQYRDSSVMIRVSNHRILEFGNNEIASISKELKTNTTKLPDTNCTIKYHGIIEVGINHELSSSSNQNQNNNLKINIINGIKADPNFAIGLGFGIRYYIKKDILLVPFFLDLQFQFSQKKISPYLSIDLGYSFFTSDEFRGYGFLANPSLGVKIAVTNQNALYLGIGYEIQSVSSNSQNYFRSNESIKAISLHAGFSL